MAGRIFAALLLFATIAVAAGCKRASPLPPNVSRLLAELRSPICGVAKMRLSRSGKSIRCRRRRSKLWRRQ
jgi:hypothetical protein